MTRTSTSPMFDSASIPGGKYTFYAAFAAFFVGVGYVALTRSGGRIHRRTSLGAGGPGWRSGLLLSETDYFRSNPLDMTVEFGIPELRYPPAIRRKIARYQELERKIEKQYLAGKSPHRLEGRAAELLEQIDTAVQALAEEGEGYQPSRDLDDPIEVRFAHEYAQAMREPSMEWLGSRLRGIEGMDQSVSDEQIQEAAAEAYLDRRRLLRRLEADAGKRPALQARRWLRRLQKRPAPVIAGRLPRLT